MRTRNDATMMALEMALTALEVNNELTSSSCLSLEGNPRKKILFTGFKMVSYISTRRTNIFA
jgi:hypothetical protein